MKAANSIWRASNQESKLPSERPPKDFIKFYANRLDILLGAATPFVLVLLVAAPILIVRHIHVLPDLIARIPVLAVRYPRTLRALSFGVIVVGTITLLHMLLKGIARTSELAKKYVHILWKGKTAEPDCASPDVAKTTSASTARIINDIYVLPLSGSLAAPKCDELVARVRQLIDEGYRRILIDLRNVGYIDSRGIGTLVSCFTMVNREGGQMKLLALSPAIRNLLKLETYADEDTAFAAFSSYNIAMRDK
jgi:anti-sigma B factor antagonist